ncbi:MAG: hypothetical protein RMJ55_08465 [Roseiflexaceae bacterium]|nr:hypothetical protein [Roseiflexaceae bacterium]
MTESLVPASRSPRWARHQHAPTRLAPPASPGAPTARPEPRSSPPPPGAPSARPYPATPAPLGAPAARPYRYVGASA